MELQPTLNIPVPRSTEDNLLLWPVGVQPAVDVDVAMYFNTKKQSVLILLRCFRAFIETLRPTAVKIFVG